MKNLQLKKIVVVSSGGFDPIHIGHIRMFKEAKKMGDIHIVILNNDNWLLIKKGFIFMPQQERKEVIEALECVDKVVITKHRKNTQDMSVVKELERINPHIFVNGGDRKQKNIPELALCKKVGIKPVFNVGYGGKVQSSSWLLSPYEEFLKKSYQKNIKSGKYHKA